MKQTRLILLTVIVTLSAFGTIIYSSCKKDPCNGVNCQNGGACSGGNCVCPSGYSGNFCENSSITYVNDTYTPINITVNGSNTSIPVGSSVSFVGVAGSAAVLTASTSGSTSSGTQVGTEITWSFTEDFPTGGAGLSEPLDVPAAYFYLSLANVSGLVTTSVTVNYSLASTTTDNIAVPADGATYGIGYYLAYSNTKVAADYVGGDSYVSPTFYIPNTLNAAATVTLH